MNKKTIRIAGWALGLSMAVAGIGTVAGASANALVEAEAAPGDSVTKNLTLSGTGAVTASDSFPFDISYTGTWSWSSPQLRTSDSSATVTFAGGSVVDYISTIVITCSSEGYTVAGSATNSYTTSKSSNKTTISKGAATGVNSLTWTTGGSARLKSIAVTFVEASAATYTVTYDANGATSGSVPTDSSAYDNNASVTVLGNTGGLAKTNYNFTGWNTQDDGEGVHYDEDDNFSITANTTLYAEWEDTRTYVDATTNSSHLTLSGDTHVITGTEDAELLLTADGKWLLPAEITVTMNDAELVAETDYMYSSGTGEIIFLVPLTHNVTVSGTATAASITSIDVAVDSSETAFYLGHEFTHETAVVTATYNDLAGTTEDVTGGCAWSNPDMFAVGAKTITVTHTPSGLTDTYSVTVSNKTVSEARFQKVTSTANVVTGDYLIVCEGQEVAFNGGIASSSYDVSNNTVPVSPSAGLITYSAALSGATFHYDAATGYFQSAAGYYIGRTANSNGLNAVSSSPTSSYAHTITVDGSGNTTLQVTTTGSNKAYLRYNKDSGQEKFRYYTNSSSCLAVQLYKYIPAVVKELVKITATVKPGTRYIGGAVTASDFNVTAYYDDGTSASVVATSLENASLVSASNTVTVKYTEGGVTKSADVVVAAEENTATLVSLSWAQTGPVAFVGEEIDFSELATVYANYDEGDPVVKLLEACEVGLYTRDGEIYTKDSSISDGRPFTASDNGKYLCVSYEENDVTVFAYSSTPVSVVATIGEVYAQVPTYSFSKVTEIKDGDVVTFVNESSMKVASGMGTNIINATSYVGDVTTSFTFTIGKVGDYYTFHNANGYLGNHSTGTSGSNYAYLDQSIDVETNMNYFNVSFDEGNVIINSVYDTNRNLRFNSDRFCFYGSGQSVVQLYKGSAGFTPTGENLANTDAVAQKAALEFVADFNADMDCEGTNGNTANVQSKWSSLSAKFTAKMAGLAGSTLANFKQLFAYAYSVEGGDALQDMLARYDYIISKYNAVGYGYDLADFLSTGADRAEVSMARSATRDFTQPVIAGSDSSVVITLVSVGALVAAGGFFLISRKHREEE